MDGIFDTNDSFDFTKLVLTKPSLISGGNYFIRCLVNNSPLYIQPPKCKTKQGILKAGKRYYTDLMFTNEDATFIQWMENLENHCQQFIFNNREKWFDGEMELHDIENYFTSPLKLFKSGKYYIARTGISTALNNITLKIYDENENEVAMENIDDKTNVTTILEIQGIKCSTRCFQVELELKQMMVMNPADMFQKCIIKGLGKSHSVSHTSTSTIEQPVDRVHKPHIETDENIILVETIELPNDVDATVEIDLDDEDGENNKNGEIDNHGETILEEEKTMVEPDKNPNEMQEVEFNLEELKDAGEFQIKKRNDVYYEMYREARRKAKIARDLALSSYLEVKRIKNTYMLDDLKDSDESDLEMNDEDDDDDSDSEDNEENEKDKNEQSNL
uniref:Uncharacterized protein n=1 Tax=viral metagenome TaxID=1070528 RepID=A0A6C0JJ18_9ZZZZ